mmetsp:Transcript_11767/g.54771  ORF Transcript_11767/g.54771 Transcript_11767/m.54771 type:complete len:281 (+) Transcript_11767:438-1280(+)
MPAKVRLNPRRRLGHLLQVVERVDDVVGVLREFRDDADSLEELAVFQRLVVGVERELLFRIRRRGVRIVFLEPIGEPLDRLELVRGWLLFRQGGEGLHQCGLEFLGDVLARGVARRNRVEREVREEKLELSRRGCWRVGSVRRVLGAVGAELGAQGLGRVLSRGEGVRGSHQRAPVLDGVVLGEAARDDRAAGHEPHQVWVERLPFVLGVEFARSDGVHDLLLAPDDDEPGVLGDLQDVVHLASRDGVGLDHGVRLLEALPLIGRRGHRSLNCSRFGIHH